MIKQLRQIHRIWFVFCIILIFILLYPAYYLFSRNEKYYSYLNSCRKLHCKISSCMAGVFFNFRFQSPLHKNQTYIYCANHTSMIDLMILTLLAEGDFHFMGKIELLNSPFFGIFFKTIDIPVDRKSKIASFRAFQKASENLKKGRSLIIFPEGKIHDEYPPILNEFKNGPFRLAITHKIPLVPISIINAWQLFFDDGIKYGSKPGNCDIYIHKPIITESLTVDDTDLLKDQVYEQMNSKLI